MDMVEVDVQSLVEPALDYVIATLKAMSTAPKPSTTASAWCSRRMAIATTGIRQAR